MTAFAFAIAILFAALIALRFPFVGLCLYVWLDMFASQDRFIYGTFALPYSQIAAIATVVGCLINIGKLQLRANLLIALMVLYGLWITVTTWQAVFPETAWVKWDRPIKTIFMILLFIPLIDSIKKLEVLIFCLVLPVVISSFVGVVGLLRGSAMNIDGASSSLYASTTLDRNFLAARFVACIPLVVALMKSDLFAEFRLRRYVFAGMIVLLTFGVVSSFSRGAFLGLIVVGLSYTLISKKRVLTTALVLLLCIGVIIFAPDSWTERVSGVFAGTGTAESSARSRLESWGWAWEYVNKHPIFGGGFTIYLANVSPTTRAPLDMHSFLFELLAEQGFIGTFIYLFLLVYCVVKLLSGFRMKRVGVSSEKYSHLCGSLLIAILGLFSAGLFLNMANQVLPFYLFALSAVLFLAGPAGLASDKTPPGQSDQKASDLKTRRPRASIFR